MPIYDYVCGACGVTTEVVHGIHDEGPRFCPVCGAKGRMKKAFAPPTIVFKGSGWAKKDRASTATSGRAARSGRTAKSGPGDSTDASGGSTAGTTDPSTSSGGSDV
jgi:putative FmdB family regulatory protein